MSSYAGFVCWNPAETQPVFAPMVEAATDATFLATHLSLPVDPVEGRHVGHGPQSEAAVMEAFLAEETDPLIMAVVGPAGSGKSHIIRWIAAQLQEDFRYLVVYVTREETNLRLVLRSILEQLPGDEPRRLLGDIQKATETLAPKRAIANVFDFVVNRLEYEPPPMPADQQRLRDYLLSEGGFPALLRHQAVRNMMIAEGGVIAANVRVALDEYNPDEGPPPVFTPEDLHIRLRHGVGGLDQGSARLLEALNHSQPALRNTAVDLLNLCLDEAISDLLGLTSSVSLTEVMTEARQLVALEKRELVLLVEDFALFDRIGRPLIDALVVPARSGRGVKKPARLRTAFAMTSDPFLKLPETLKSRVVLQYRTGQVLGEGSLDRSRVVDFVGTYLNALRVSRQGIEDAWAEAAQSKRASEWMPNACDTCEHEPVCRNASGFGQSGRSHGLYPLNEAAIEHLTEASLEEGRFVPRTLLTRVLAPLVETDAEELANGRFPAGAFEARASALPNARALPPPAAEVSYGLEQRGDGERHRRVRTLRFWQQSPVTRAFDLHESIHEAFQLPPLGDTAPPPPPPPPREPSKGSAGRRPPDEDDLSADMEAIDRWSSDAESALPPELANRIRKRLHDLVLSQLRLNDQLIALDLEELGEEGSAFSVASFAITRGSGRTPKPTAVTITLEATAANAVLFKAVLRLERNEQFLNTNDYVLVLDRLRPWVAQVLERSRSLATTDEGTFPLPHALRTLIASAWVHPEGDGSALRDPVAAVHAGLRPFRLSGDAGRGVTATAWSRLIDAAAGDDREAVRTRLIKWVQAAQGVGKVQAIDLERLTAMAKDFLADPVLLHVGRAAPNELRGLAQLFKNLESAALDEANRIIALAERVDWRVVEEQERVASALINALRDAAAVGVFEPGTEKERFERECADFAKTDLSSINVLRMSEPGLRSEDLIDRLEAIRSAQPAAVLAEFVIRFTNSATAYMTASRAAAERELMRVFPSRTPLQAADGLRDVARSAASILEDVSGSR